MDVRHGKIDRRTFAKTALAIGGSAALSACVGRDEDALDVPAGTDDRDTLPTGQHEWDDALGEDQWGNIEPPRHHLFLLLDLTTGGPPSEADRETVETAFQSLERAYEWSNEGLLFTVGYTPAYFDRFDESLHQSIALPEPEPLASFESPDPDLPDIGLHLASDEAAVLLEAEESLFGETDPVNADMEATLDGVVERPSEGDTDRRRTGFIGEGLPADNSDVQGIPSEAPIDEDAPLFMNFKSGFLKNQASEGRITIDEGPFAGGTTQHLSKIRLNLHQWYNQDTREDREALMFCPVHAAEGRVDGPGHNLGTDSRMDGDCIDDVEGDAREYGRVGHSQKMAAAARENDEPLILRRDFNSTDDGHAGLHFLSVQESIADFVQTREAMNGSDIAETTGVGQRNNNGILQYLTVHRRGNYLLPPRPYRSLPTPNP